MAIFNDLSDITLPFTGTSLTINNLTSSLTIDDVNFPNLEDATITSSGTSDIFIRIGNVFSQSTLTSLTTNSCERVFLSSNCVVENLTVNGPIVGVCSWATTLSSLNLSGATYKDDPSILVGETPIGISINDSTSLTSIDLSSLERVSFVYITGNTALTSVIAPSTLNPLTDGAVVDLLTARIGFADFSGAEALIVNDDFRGRNLQLREQIGQLLGWFHITANNITGTYTSAIAAYPGDGVNPPIPYVEASLTLPGLVTWPGYIYAVNGTQSSDVTFKFDYVSGGIADSFGQDVTADPAQTFRPVPTASDHISTLSDLSIIDTSSVPNPALIPPYIEGVYSQKVFSSISNALPSVYIVQYGRIFIVFNGVNPQPVNHPTLTAALEAARSL